jgi:hypothetical protein
MTHPDTGYTVMPDTVLVLSVWLSNALSTLMHYFTGAPAAVPETGLGRADDSFNACSGFNCSSGLYPVSVQLAFAVYHLSSARVQ